MTTIKQVNKQLQKLGYAGKMFRSPSGYYYFTNDLSDVESLYVYNINVMTIEQVINHVKQQKNKA